MGIEWSFFFPAESSFSILGTGVGRIDLAGYCEETRSDSVICPKESKEIKISHWATDSSTEPIDYVLI
jgi:hypothetical protein